ncbi:UbiA family prenyltransferase [Saprospiraceae bacterium]|nr:UbiA family prenyltransferase [Saprospiraceae bacterium]
MKTKISRLRPANLLIITITQLFFYYIVILPFFRGFSGSIIPHFHILLIIFITLIVTVGGYIINDIRDHKIDKVNKPNKALSNITQWTLVYKLLFIVGLIAVIWLSSLYHHPFFLAIFLLAWSALYLYSSTWKCKPLIGNLVVSFFSGAVILVLLGPFFTALLSHSPQNLDNLIRPLFYYFVFAFFTSLIREIVKDMEDVEGDESCGCQTLAVSAGIARTRFFTMILIITFLGFFGLWQFIYAADYPLFAIVFLNAFVTLPFIYCINSLQKARISHDFTRISNHIKIIMLLGVLFLVFEM